MGLIVRNVGVQCDDCGAEIAAGSPVYVLEPEDEADDRSDLTFCSHKCLANNQINFNAYSDVEEYLRVVGSIPKKKP